MKTEPLFIDIHILQTVPPSNINRDDTGSPKTARFGGVTRARVSSQAWKNATRKAFSTLLDSSDLGQRTKYAVDLISEYLRKNAEEEISDDEVEQLAADVLGKTGIKVTKSKQGKQETGYLLFISPRQAEALAMIALKAHRTGEEVDKKDAQAVLNVKQNPALNAIDIALFGRMVADAPDSNTDAAVQVAHAIGIGKAETEFDYFTAMDDRAADDQSGAAMIETTEFISSTLYRYATIDVRHLFENLGSSAAACKAIEAFIQGFVTSMPTGKQNSFANRTLPSAVIVQLRNTQPVSLVNAFVVPVNVRDGEDGIEAACDALVKQERLLDEAFGVRPESTYVLCAAGGAGILKEMVSEDIDGMKDMVASIGRKSKQYLSQFEEAQERQAQ